MRIGVALWIMVTSAWLTLEGIGFVDKADGLPTASQLVKEWKRKSRRNRTILTVLLFAAAPILYAHWVAEWF